MNAKDRKLIYERIYPWMERLGFSLDEEKSGEWRATGMYFFNKQADDVKYSFELVLDVNTWSKKARMDAAIGYVFNGEIKEPKRYIPIALGVAFRPPLTDHYYDTYEELVGWLDLIQPMAEFCLLAQQVSIDVIYNREDLTFFNTGTEGSDYRAHNIPKAALNAINKRYRVLMDEFPTIAKMLEEYGWSPTKSYA